MQKIIKFMNNPGGCIVSKRILNGESDLKWMVREKSIDKKTDNGWRFFSVDDDDDYLADPNNLAFCDFNTVANIEPAILGIYLYPVGSDFQLVRDENGKITIYNNKNQKEVKLKYK